MFSSDGSIFLFPPPIFLQSYGLFWNSCTVSLFSTSYSLDTDIFFQWLHTQVADNSESQNTMGRGVQQKFVRQLLTLLFTVWKSYSPDKKGGPNVDWSSLGSTLMNYRDRVDLSADAKTNFNKLARVLGIKWYVLLFLYNGAGAVFKNVQKVALKRTFLTVMVCFVMKKESIRQI